MIQLPLPIFTLALWGAIGTVGLASGWLLVVLIREWKAGHLW
jgi:hypothetical protein